MLVTIALSEPANALSKLDFPALGAPANTILAPSFSFTPWLAIFKVLDANCSISFKAISVLPDSKKSSCSSGKSRHASSLTLKFVICSDREFKLSEKAHYNEAKAAFAAL